MNIKQVYPDIGSIELDYLSSSIDNKWLTEGPLCEKFISKMRSLTKAKYAVLAPNGIDNDPYERNAKPKPKSINPIEKYKILYTFSEIRFIIIW